ncbi:MAG: TRAP transporter large permease [Thermodesulfobacteriota bacterium]
MLMLIVVIIFLMLSLLGLPIFFSFGVTAALACIFGDYPLQIIAQRMMIGMDSFALLAVPGFIVAGDLMSQGGISQRLVDFSNSLVAHLKGGLAMVTVLTGMIMGGISGSAVADTAAVATVLVPSMEKEKYPKDFAAAVVGSAGPLGNIIPPSIPMVIYSMVSGLSLLDLFLAGYVPGMMIGFSLMFFCHWVSKKKGFGRETARFSPREVLVTFRRSILAVIMPLIIVGGVLSGVFTATESAMIGVVYAFFVAVFIYKEISWRELPGLLLNSAKATAKLVIIMASASVFSYISIREGVPDLFKDLMLGLSSNKYVILLALNIILLLLGCVIDILVATIILVPVIIPLAQVLGVDQLHIAMIFVINMSIGLLTPPVGYSLYVASTIAQAPFERVSRAAVPVVLVMAVILALVTVFPGLSLFVPNLFH